MVLSLKTCPLVVILASKRRPIRMGAGGHALKNSPPGCFVNRAGR